MFIREFTLLLLSTVSGVFVPFETNTSKAIVFIVFIKFNSYILIATEFFLTFCKIFLTFLGNAAIGVNGKVIFKVLVKV